jgi:hypothetical protein
MPLYDKQKDVLRHAMSEAERFLIAGNRALKEDCWHNVESAAVKRASLDLTRALAKFRQS